MKGKKVSDLKKDPAFLKDAVTFLKSRRKGWTDEELKQLTPDDVSYEILEHFRVMNTNEVSMSRDYYYVKDDKTADNEKQAYARLMNTFDNAKGEGILDGGFAVSSSLDVLHDRIHRFAAFDPAPLHFLDGRMNALIH
jgi:hypothetical protein